MNPYLLSSGLYYHTKPAKNAEEHILEGLHTLKRNGFEAVDFDLGIFGNFDQDFSACIERVKKEAENLGLIFGQCHLPFIPQKSGAPEEHADFGKIVLKAMDTAKALGISYSVIHPNSTTLPLDGYDYEGERDRVLRFLEPFADYAQKIGIGLLIENMRRIQKEIPTHRYCAMPEEVCTVADALGLGVCWDTGHAHITGLTQSKAIKTVGKRLKVLHLNDNLADDDLHLAPFLGTINWQDTMDGLRAINYKGTLNFEISAHGIPFGAVDAFCGYVASSGKCLIAMI